MAPEPTAEMAKANELRGIIAQNGFATGRAAEMQTADGSYNQAKGLIGKDNDKAKQLLTSAIAAYQKLIDGAVASLSTQKKSELDAAKKAADAANAASLAADDYNKAKASQASAETALQNKDYKKAWSDYDAATNAYAAGADKAKAAGALVAQADKARAEVEKAKKNADAAGAASLAADDYAKGQASQASMEAAITAKDYNKAVKDSEAAIAAYNDSAEAAAKVAAELAALAAQAEKHRADVAGAKQAADAVNAGTFAPQEYEAAQENESAMEAAIAAKDFDKAASDAEEAVAAYGQSAERAAEVSAQVDKRRAEVEEAKARADEADAPSEAPEAYAQAQESQAAAEGALEAKDMDKAWQEWDAAIAAYNESADLATAKKLPEYYTVRLIPGRRDCFWRIAEYVFVYASPDNWRLLYDENRHLLQDPNNPELIQPGTRLRIPSQAGERRSGDWRPEQ
jgi:hypothetical protein